MGQDNFFKGLYFFKITPNSSDHNMMEYEFYNYGQWNIARYHRPLAAAYSGSKVSHFNVLPKNTIRSPLLPYRLLVYCSKFVFNVLWTVWWMKIYQNSTEYHYGITAELEIVNIIIQIDEYKYMTVSGFYLVKLTWCWGESGVLWPLEHLGDVRCWGGGDRPIRTMVDPPLLCDIIFFHT